MRVRPYYIYQADYVEGTEHLRTTVEKGLEIMDALRGWTSGLAVPYYVIDAPGGGGKIPILPNYIQSISDEQVVMRNYAGELYVYPQAPEPKKKPKRESSGLRRSLLRRDQRPPIGLRPEAENAPAPAFPLSCRSAFGCDSRQAKAWYCLI